MRVGTGNRRVAATLLAIIIWSIVQPAEAQPVAPRASDVVVAGAEVSGIVTVAGPLPRPKPLPVFKNRAYCGASVPDRSMLITKKGGLQNAAILLRPRGRKVSRAPGQAVLDNKSCAFTPRIQIVTPGTELLLKNSDPILHTVHARLGRETLFNVGLPKWRQVTKRLERAGVVRIDCDVLHTWMSAAIVVTDTPFFAVTDGSGRFNIENLPAGEYSMEIWHERLGTRSEKLVVSGGMSRFVDIVYSSK